MASASFASLSRGVRRPGDSEGWVAFVDDDDWLSPGLFESLPAAPPGKEGARWGWLRLGRVFASNGYAEPIIQRRSLKIRRDATGASTT
jgi:hypothetical protein